VTPGPTAARATNSGVNVGTDRRRLAFVYHPFSFPTMATVNAAQGICDLVWVLDTSVAEVELMARLLRRLGAVVDVGGLSLEQAAAAIAAAHPDGLLALADSQLVWTAQIAERLGLPFMTAAAAERASDKYTQRRALAAAGVPVPAHWLIPPLDDAPAWTALGPLHFPAMLKPRQGSGSRGVVRVESLAQLRGLLAAPDGGAGTPALLEEYLPDRPGERGQSFAGYVSVESVVSDGRASHLAVTGRFPLAEPFRETGFFIPAALAPGESEAMIATAEATIAALGVGIGCVHTEIKLTPDGPRVIELNGRIGGSVAKMLPVATGIDTLTIAMRLALGEHVVHDAMPPSRKVTFMLYVQAPMAMRRIRSVEGMEALRADPAVLELILKRGPGQSVDWREGNHGHVFSVLGVVADHDELKALARRVADETRIEGE
jgi:biotin carboxylase